MKLGTVVWVAFLGFILWRNFAPKPTRVAAPGVNVNVGRDLSKVHKYDSELTVASLMGAPDHEETSADMRVLRFDKNSMHPATVITMKKSSVTNGWTVTDVMEY